MDGATDGTRILRRYANRKFYDPFESRYVNYDEIARLIRMGSEVRVLEFETKRDVTGMTLARILSREERRASSGSAPALSELIRRRGEGGPGVATMCGVEAAPRVAPPAEGVAAARSAAAATEDPHDLARRLIARGHRSAWCAGQTASAAFEAVARLEGRARQRADAASDVVASVERLWRALSRITRRIDDVHERLRQLEEN